MNVLAPIDEGEITIPIAGKGGVEVCGEHTPLGNLLTKGGFTIERYKPSDTNYS